MTPDEAIPYDDREALWVWIERHTGAVPPLALERLLSHHRFVEAGPVPTQGRAKCVAWRHELADTDARFANLRLLVYHTDVVSVTRVAVAFSMLRAADRLERHVARRQSSSP